MTAVAAIPFPALDPIAFRVGPLAVHWYGLAYVAGFVVAGLVLRMFARRWGVRLSDDDVIEIVVFATVGVVVGGRLGYVLIYGGWDYLSDPVSVLRLWDGGMSFHGGLAGLLLAGVLAARRLRMPVMTLFDLGAIGAPVGLFLGRLANFVNAELWGRPTNVPWAVVFPGAGPLPRHPSQLYEAVLEGLVLFTVMVWLARHGPPRPRGEVFGWFIALYGVFRIVGEFFREPDVQIGYLAAGATMGQLLSIPLVVLGAYVISRARRQRLAQAGPGSVP